MKKIVVLLFLMTISAGVFSQGDFDNTFYLRFGYSKPTAKYLGEDDKDFWDDADFKRNGIHFELGQIFIFNSLAMADGLRLGLNADYLSLYYHRVNRENSKRNIVLFGSKIGPSLSYSPVDKLVFDTYFKLNPVWISTFIYTSTSTGDEFFLGVMGIGYSAGINVRYSILMVGFEFNKSWNKFQHYDSEASEFDGDYIGNRSDGNKDASPTPSFNITIGLAF